MKHLSIKILATAAVFAAALSSPTLAQTPDGQTPAEESVCDTLQADGTTKGLYGLCVAFCEAQDITELSTPITLEELEALESSAPSGKILANYNKKKKDGDPGMPCLVVQEEETCPCFTDAELASFDGITPDGSQADRFRCSSGQLLFGSSLLRSDISEQSFSPSLFHYAGVFENTDIGSKNCIFNFSRFLSVGQGTITPEEFETCRVKLNEYIPNSGCQLEQ